MFVLLSGLHAVEHVRIVRKSLLLLRRAIEAVFTHPRSRSHSRSLVHPPSTLLAHVIHNDWLGHRLIHHERLYHHTRWHALDQRHQLRQPPDVQVVKSLFSRRLHVLQILRHRVENLARPHHTDLHTVPSRSNRQAPTINPRERRLIADLHG